MRLVPLLCLSLHLLILNGIGRPALSAAQLPTQVPTTELESDPYRHAGLVRTESYGPDYTVLGSGWVASNRVVATAAHVFFVDETLGWNRNRWSWLRAAPPGAFWSTQSMATPRSYRVLAGYAEAAARYVRAADQDQNAAILDSFNRDNLALLFYRNASIHPAPPRALSALEGTGTYTIVGYPADLGDQEVPEIAMYAQLGGASATFTGPPASKDYLDRPFVIAQTQDIVSGPGGSGGPVFKQINGAWTVVGTLVGGTSDFSAGLARAVDAEFDQLLTRAAADTVALGSGNLVWEAPGAMDRGLIFPADGSLITQVGGEVTCYDATGLQRWRRASSSYAVTTMAESPDGRILIVSPYALIVLEPTSGAELQRVALPYSTGLAVGEIGEAYVASDQQVTRISPTGATDWTLAIPFDPVQTSGNANPVIGTDGTVYLVAHDRIHAIAPTDGTVRWRTAQLPGIFQNSLSPRPDGSLIVGTATSISCFEADGTLRWLEPANGARPDELHVGHDGTIVAPLNLPGRGFVVLDVNGRNRREITTSDNVQYVTRDANGSFYASSFSGVTAYASDGTVKWTQPTASGPLVLGPANLLYTYANSSYARLAALSTDATVADLTWQAHRGGFDNAHRVANTAPVAPRMVSSPASSRVVLGNRLELTATAEGSFPLTFEWRRDGTLLTDQVGQKLVIRNTTAADAGSYTVTVRNVAGTDTSTPATVTVGAANFGDRLWTTTIEPIFPPAIGDDDLVYVCSLVKENVDATAKPTLIALDASGDERWRRDLSVAGGSTDVTCPVIGDDGRIYVVLPGTVWAWSAAGDLLWRYDFAVTGYGSNVDIALSRSNGVFFRAGGRAGALDAAGTPLWLQEAPYYDRSWNRLLVRRDGQLTNGSAVVINDQGGKQALGVGPFGGTVLMLGPEDEWIVADKTLDRDGNLVSRNPAASNSTARLMMLDGTLVSNDFNLDSFRGGTSTYLSTGRSGGVAAVLEGDRLLWVDDFNRITLYDRAGHSLAEADAEFGRNVTVSRSGVLLAGPHLSAYHLGNGLARSAWPIARADSRNTSRAPTAFTLTPAAPASVQILGRTDPRGEYPVWVTYRTDPIVSYVGYSAYLAASVEGSGPFTYQWTRDGTPLNRPDARTGELYFAAFTTADAGDYRVTVTNATGTATSTGFSVTVLPPSPVTPGTYVRTIATSNGREPFTAVYTITANRTLQLTLMQGLESSGTATIDPSGRFLTSGIGSWSGTVTGTEIEIDYWGSSVAPRAAVTGRAPNNLRAGVYRGHSTGAIGYPVTVVVYADGSFDYYNSANYFQSATGSFSGASTRSHLTIDRAYGTQEMDLTGRTDGALVGTVTNPSTSLNAITGFVALHPDRPPVERLTNISTLGYVADVTVPMVAGFVVEGSQPSGFLLRAVGPGLVNFGLPETLREPHLALVPLGGNQIAAADAWHRAPDPVALSASATRLGAFALESTADDAAMLATLPQGLYTMPVTDPTAAKGMLLLEVYEDRAAVPSGNQRLRNLSTRGSINRTGRTLSGGFVIDGEVPKSILIRAIGPGLLPYTGGAFTPASDPVFKVFRLGETEPLATVDDYWTTGVEAEINAASARVGAFALAQGSNDAATVLALPPGPYSVQVSNRADDTGVVLLEIYELPPP